MSAQFAKSINLKGSFQVDDKLLSQLISVTRNFTGESVKIVFKTVDGAMYHTEVISEITADVGLATSVVKHVSLSSSSYRDEPKSVTVEFEPTMFSGAIRFSVAGPRVIAEAALRDFERYVKASQLGRSIVIRIMTPLVRVIVALLLGLIWSVWAQSKDDPSPIMASVSSIFYVFIVYVIIGVLFDAFKYFYPELGFVDKG